MKKRKRPHAERRRPGDGRKGREEGAGEQIEVSIERILPGGTGLAHSGGRTPVTLFSLWISVWRRRSAGCVSAWRAASEGLQTGWISAAIQ